MKQKISRQDNDYVYLKTVSAGTCAPDISDESKEYLYKSLLQSVLNPEVECQQSCQTLEKMSKDKAKPLSLNERNALKFEKISDRKLFYKKDSELFQRIIGIYFEFASKVDKIRINYDNERVYGNISLIELEDKLKLYQGFNLNFHQSSKLQLTLDGIKPTKKGNRNLAVARTELLRV